MYEWKGEDWHGNICPPEIGGRRHVSLRGDATINGCGQPCIPLKPSKPSQDQSSSKQRPFKINVLLPAWLAKACVVSSSQKIISRTRSGAAAAAGAAAAPWQLPPASMLLRGKHVMHVCVCVAMANISRYQPNPCKAWPFLCSNPAAQVMITDLLIV